MSFIVNKDELILTLESILETRGDDTLEDYAWAQGAGVSGGHTDTESTTRQEIQDWLLLLQRFPLESKTYLLSDQQAYFIMDHLD